MKGLFHLFYQTLCLRASKNGNFNAKAKTNLILYLAGNLAQHYNFNFGGLPIAFDMAMRYTSSCQPHSLRTEISFVYLLVYCYPFSLKS